MRMQTGKLLLVIVLLTQFQMVSDVYAVDAETLLIKAQEAVHHGDFRQAIMHYQRLIKDEPERAEYRAGLGYSYEMSNRLVQAEELANSALEIDKNNVDALMVIGRLKARLEDWQSAKDYFQRAIEADGEKAMAWAGLSQAAIGLGDLDLAEEASTKFQKFSQTVR